MAYRGGLPVFFNPEQCRNETEVESKFIVQYLLPHLGYEPGTWYQEVELGKIRLDFLVFAARHYQMDRRADIASGLVIEAKSPHHHLGPFVKKLEYYLTELWIPYGVLTNGKLFKIYSRINQKIHCIFECRGASVHAQIGMIRTIIGRDEIQSLQGMRSTKVSPSPPPPLPISTSPPGDPPCLIPELSTFSLPPKTMRTIAIYHNKGGVGKTTTVVNLAAALSKQGKRVLVIDLDSQANTTFAVGLVQFDDEEDALSKTLSENNIQQVLSSEEMYPIKAVAQTAHSFCTPPIDVVPAHIDLMRAENELNSQENARFILSQKLHDVEHDYDIVLIDTPPSLNLFARYALIAADYLIIPSDLKPFANQGLKNVQTLVKDVNNFRRNINRTPIQLLGVLANKISTNARFVQSTLPKRMQAVTDRYGLKMMESIIYEREFLAKCAEQVRIIDGREVPDPRSVVDFNPSCASAQEFQDLALEVLAKIAP
ncbi:AAA family ATPase [Spirulina sp. CCNP1310]|uniref:AAA family ATPase n=1 Tax=Spirulina sp. CCNP1310 TaxID=3110249 RepID=UPI002B1E90DF|nr:AAA family ATPase [Spirulina sp. CCNP1310]MEA5420965.1 AAA family ATPase [Spirulina sp. CCNP1310]